MPIDTYAGYAARVTSPSQRIRSLKSSLLPPTSRLLSLWTRSPIAGTIPGGAAICTRTLAGAMPLQSFATVGRLAQVEGELATAGTVVLADRLYHVGGLSGLVTTPQAVTSLQLTRYPDGLGVIAVLEIYGTVGSTATTATMTYIDDADVVRVSPPTLFGGTEFREVDRAVLIPLAQGSRGVKSVSDVTLAATTGTAGNFGVTLYRPLMIVPDLFRAQMFGVDALLGLAGNLATVWPEACLVPLAYSVGSTFGPFSLEIRVIEE